jgi:Holliday junction resolvase
MNTTETLHERFRRETYELELKREREQQVKLSDEQIARLTAWEQERSKLNLIIPRG